MNRRSMLIPVAVLAATVAASPASAGMAATAGPASARSPTTPTRRTRTRTPSGAQPHHRLAGDLGHADRQLDADGRRRSDAPAARPAAEGRLHRHPPRRADVPPHRPASASPTAASRARRRTTPRGPSRSARTRGTATASTGPSTPPPRGSRPSTCTRTRPRSARRRCATPTKAEGHAGLHVRRADGVAPPTAISRTPATPSSRWTRG